MAWIIEEEIKEGISIASSLTKNTFLTIKSNEISSNKIGLSIPSSAPNIFYIHENNIISNDIAVKINAFDYQSQDVTENFDLSNNYWGTTDIAAISKMIFDYYDSFDLSKVNYQPTAEKMFAW